MSVDPSDLLSASDVARLLGVGPSAVSNWRRRNVGFPAPVATVNLGRTPLFSRAAVVAWAIRNVPPALVALIRAEPMP